MATGDLVPTRPALRTRTGGQWLWLAGLAALFALLWAAGMPPTLAALGFGIVAVMSLFLPTSGPMPVAAPAGVAGTAGPAGAPDLLPGMRAMADALPMACLLTDPRLILTHANAPALSQFPRATPGAPLPLIVRHPAVLAAAEQVVASGEGQSIEISETVPTATWARVDIARVDAASDTGQAALVLLFADLTAHKRIEAMRADFVANASHELRTPLTSVIGFIDTLLGPAAKDPVAQKKFLGIMRAQAERMSKLIDDLMSLSRIELRQHVRPSGKANLASLVREVAEALAPQARAADVELDLDLATTETEITGDRDELYEVIENLVDNAIKYGASGKQVRVSLQPSVRPGFDLMLTVTDKGPGVAAEHVPRLTERFYRVDAESSRKLKGTGLGLAIVKHIVTRHRGAMSVRSELGQGTSVEILFRRSA